MIIKYRPEIDGIRAIAVISVIFYHFQISVLNYRLFQGGFVGVDIFFVISGYLITSIILIELVDTGSFSLKYFYERRIRRILPALLLIMLLFFPFAWIYLTPDRFIDFVKSILYSLSISSNFYFNYSGQQYGADSGLLKPFLHTWSLSIEEQYYILFPIILLISFKYFIKYLIHILIFGVVISLSLADWGSTNYPSYNFYLLPTRVWELLAGSILAYFEIIKKQRSLNNKFNLVFPLIGSILIAHSIVFFNDRMFHPSFYTLSPVVGVCLIIWFSNKNEIITKILSSKLLVGVGLISYSLYLWHYPILAFSRLTDFFYGGILNKLLISLMIIILSIVSYYFIEKPFRKKKYNFKIELTLLLFISFVIVFASFKVLSENGYKNRVPDILKYNSSEN
jgi:peptidoglycan/LPS O-acetylase OafA/YrhL